MGATPGLAASSPNADSLPKMTIPIISALIAVRATNAELSYRATVSPVSRQRIQARIATAAPIMIAETLIAISRARASSTPGKPGLNQTARLIRDSRMIRRMIAASRRASPRAGAAVVEACTPCILRGDREPPRQAGSPARSEAGSAAHRAALYSGHVQRPVREGPRPGGPTDPAR